MSKASEKAQEHAEYLAQLAERIPAGQTVYTVTYHVSQSGMSRAMAAYYIEAGEPRWINLANALGYRASSTHSGFVVKGAGMDMGFHVVYSLSSALHGDGYALSQRAL